MSLLGQILAGESATPQGQQAVLNVIQNRAAINFGGHGTDLLSQATAFKQFSAYPNALGNPSSTTEAMVTAAQNGTLGNIVPNSLNYANPAAVSNPNSWVWSAQASGDGTKIGGNTFWANDKGGSPGFDPSQSFHPDISQTNGSGTTDGNFNDASYYGTPQPSQVDVGQTSTGSSVSSGLDPNSGFGSQSPFYSVDQSAPQSSDTTANAQTVPWAIDQQTMAQAAAANALAKSQVQGSGIEATATVQGAQAQAKGAQQDTNATLQSTQGWIGNIENWFTTLFARGGFILIGLVFVGFALYMLASREGMLPAAVSTGK